MNKKAKVQTKTWIYIILILAGGIFLYGMYTQKYHPLFAVTGSETMTRTASAISGSSFTITYTAVGTSGTWGASIVDNVAGNCNFPDGTKQLKTVMLSADGLTKTITMTAPSTGSCTFTGDYKYGTSATLNFPTTTVSACVPACVRPTDLCLASSSNGCGGTCPWTVTTNTPADTNCNNQVDRTELGSYINNWITGAVSRDNLGQAIVAWMA